MDNALNELVGKIVNDYFSTYEYEPLNLSIVFSDDIWETYFEARPDHRKQFSKQLPLPAFNGTIATPIELDGTFTVIVDKQYFVEDVKSNRASWVGTIVHEITHARDYQEYAKIISAPNYDEVLNTSRHRMFQLWTEFNAKRHGYYFVRKYTFDNIADTAQVPDIVNIELPGQIEYMSNEYNATTDGWKQIYVVSQFLGRLAVWEDLFPAQFNTRYIESLLSTNTWMLEMYEYLNTHRDLKIAVSSFEALRKIVRKNFQGI